MKDVTNGKTIGITAPSPDGDATQSGSGSDGEGFDNGTKYQVTLVERANKSLNRNAGPMHPSANTGSVPMISMGTRQTGKV